MATTQDIEQATGDGDVSERKHGSTYYQPNQKPPAHHHATPWDDSGCWRRLGLIGAILIPLAIVIFPAILLSLNGGNSNNGTTSPTLPSSNIPNTTNGTLVSTTTSSTLMEEEQRLKDDLLALQQEYFGKKFVVGKRCDAGSIMGVTRLLPSNDDTSTIVSRVIVPFGKTTRNETDNPAVPITEDTLFEIGSVSKPLTALILADIIAGGSLGELGLDTPLNNLLPEEIPELKLQDQQDLVTLRQLVTHTAGLPRLSATLLASLNNSNIYETNPYAGYVEQDMINDLTIAATQSVALTPPNTFQYSNFGFSVLAYILSRTTGTPFSELQKTVTDRLGMNNTWIVTTASSLPAYVQDAQWLSSGYNKGDLVAHWFDGGLYIDGAGSTLSSAKDLLRWTELLMDPINDEVDLQLSEALQLSLSPLVMEPDMFDDIPNAGLAYGWFYTNYEANNSSINTSNITYSHTGGTAGYATFVAFQPSSKTAVIGMTNCAHMAEDLFEMVNVKVTELFPNNVSEILF